MIPANVNIAGIDYNVTQASGINDRFGTLGMVNYARSLIELEEDMINRVSITLYQVMKDNNLTFTRKEEE